jgi:hypothetical protein
MITWKQDHPKNGGYYSQNGMYEVSQEKLWLARKWGTIVGVGRTASEAQQCAEQHKASEFRISK